MPYKAGSRWPTSCANQPTEVPPHKSCQPVNIKWKDHLGNPNKQTISPRVAMVTNHKHYKRRGLIPRGCTTTTIDAPNVVTQSTWRDSNVLLQKYQCKGCHKFGHFTSMYYQKKEAYSKLRRPKVHQLQAGAVYACTKVHHMTTQMMTALQKIHSACKWRWNAIKQKNKESQGQHIS